MTIVFDLQANPIAGVLCNDAGDLVAPFAGWMGLTRTIEHALDAARRASGAELPPSDPSISGPDDAFH
ncbi:MAG: hypothetical protein ACRDP7_13760 [Trebonia sp.]